MFELDPVPTQERNKALERTKLLMASPTLRVAALATTDIKGVPVAAAVLGLRGEVLLDTLIHTAEPIQAGAQSVHGIRQAQLEGAPTLANALPQLEMLLSGNGLDVIFFTPEFMSRSLVRGCEREGLEMFSTADWIDGQALLTPICSAYNWSTGKWVKLTFVQAIGDLAMPGDLAPLGSALGNAQRLWHVLRHHSVAGTSAASNMEASPCPVCGLNIHTCACTSNGLDEYSWGGAR
ncbi:hypothetical protein GO986_18565 [Deinococcus sp. HMF7620]|uniref:Uncharacterized protein n=1 Tax=Deinococcus arboris TaxID=2682977 RepID=A0A7C9M8N7_9DEIO|nr:hypothetical protein [Deinococcus arboris]MVN88745.1 hypothetical protein [Deinococcus arboris]